MNTDQNLYSSVSSVTKPPQLPAEVSGNAQYLTLRIGI